MQRNQAAKHVFCLTLVTVGSILMVACQEPSGGGTAAQKARASAPAASAPAADASQLRLTAYSSGAVTVSLQHCNLEAATGTKFSGQPLALKAGQPNAFMGWVDDGGLTNPEVWLRFDEVQGNSRLHAPLRLTIERPDVTAAHPDASRTPGFNLNLPANVLPPGNYHVYVAVVSAGAAHVCDNGRQIDVGP